MTANPRELVRTVSSSKYPIAVARLGRLDAKQTPHHGGVKDRGASGACELFCGRADMPLQSDAARRRSRFETPSLMFSRYPTRKR
jgi:hypothetical protein